MQWMHQSYKCVKAHQKKLVGVHPTCLLTKTKGNLRKPIIGIQKPSSIMKKCHQYMKVRKQETLYHEDHGATLKHKCGKRIVALPLLSFSLIFSLFLFGPFLFFMASFFSFFYFSSRVSSRLVGESQSPSSFFHMGQCSNNDYHHTFIYLQLNITTRY